MALYEYRGFDSSGRPVKGTIESSNITEAREKLKSSGVYPESIDEIAERVLGKGLFSLFKRQRFVYSFTKQLSFMLEAAVPLVEAIDGIISQVKDSGQRRLLVEIKERIREGESVSEALSHYPEYFSSLYISTVRAGEMSGELAKVFRHLADHYEKNQKLAGTLKSSLTYPVFMLFFAIAVVIFLVTFIVPSFRNLFEQFGQRLPVPTRLLMGFSDFTSKFWWLILIVIMIILFAFRNIYKKNGRFKRKIDEMVLKAPLIGSFILDSFRIRFSYTLSLMISNGVVILDALNTIKDSFKNIHFKEFIISTIESIKKGDRFSNSIANSFLFPPSFAGMVGSGERSDRLAEVLQSLSENIESEMEQKIKSLTSLIEPLIIIIIGGFVGFVVLSIMLPIFQINQIF